LNLKGEEGTARYAKLAEERDRIVLDKAQEKISSLESEFADLKSKSEILSKDFQLK